MKVNDFNVQYIIGDIDEFTRIDEYRATKIFDENVIDFLDDLSKVILKNKKMREYSDVVEFAFWCRKASVLKLKEKYSSDSDIIVGRGIVFHIAPSNIPVMFAYSLALSLLAGNVNVIRLSSKEFEEVNIICKEMKKLLRKDKYSNIGKKIFLLKYGYDKTINDYLSKICDVRVIWGGDITINTIRQSPLSPRAYDLTFADRYSLSIINADKIVNEKDIKKVVKNFYNDTYSIDQNACSSPRLIIWIGSDENIQKGKNIFWEELHSVVKKTYELYPIIAMNKYVQVCRYLIDYEGLKLIKTEDQYITRLQIDNLFSEMEDIKGFSGLFLEYNSNNLKNDLKIFSRNLQTISTYGLNKSDIQGLIFDIYPYGIDRVIDLGYALKFNEVWDGYDLIKSLSRVIKIS
ncbi:acyl-CoA reductase [Tepidibacter sp. Z1-5]|uniref:acyl-CoA reductase n=1 Tax=Tepidibacter sp. Z1-5 TaxID=3134138 RepID=UPI0030C27850